MTILHRTVPNIYDSTVLQDLHLGFIARSLEEIDLQQETIYKVVLTIDRSLFLQRFGSAQPPIPYKRELVENTHIWTELPDNFATFLKEAEISGCVLASFENFMQQPSFPHIYPEMRQNAKAKYDQFLSNQKEIVRAVICYKLEQCWADLANRIEEFRLEGGFLASIRGRVFLQIITKDKGNKDVSSSKLTASSFEVQTEH